MQQEIANSADNARIEPLLWSAKQTTKALGIGERLLWSLTNRGDIPSIRIGRLVRYSPDDLRKWIASKRRGSSSGVGALS